MDFIFSHNDYITNIFEYTDIKDINIFKMINRACYRFIKKHTTRQVDISDLSFYSYIHVDKLIEWECFTNYNHDCDVCCYGVFTCISKSMPGNYRQYKIYTYVSEILCAYEDDSADFRFKSLCRNTNLSYKKAKEFIDRSYNRPDYYSELSLCVTITHKNKKYWAYSVTTKKVTNSKKIPKVISNGLYQADIALWKVQNRG